jgi:hypothetical protein
MEEGRWATRLLSEIGSARAAIAASYLNLWRTSARPGKEKLEQSPCTGDSGEVPASVPLPKTNEP